MSRVHCLWVLLVVTSQCKMLKDMDPTLFLEPAQCFLELEGKSAALTFLTLSGESRQVVKAFESIEQGEGHGARVRRSLGRPELRSLDPFLMLDEFKLENKAGEKVGFPDHPHRGFETVTYLITGSFEHEDFSGHRGLLGDGDLQWMTAGRGIVHSETPVPGYTGTTWGLQLWVNLKSSEKMCEPSYQELKGKDIPKVNADGVRVNIISGEAFGVASPVYTRTPTYYLDFEMEPHKTLKQPIPVSHNCFLYVLVGSAEFGANKKKVTAHHTILLSGPGLGTHIEVATGDEECKFVLVSGEPIGEPVVQRGPFVMNTSQQIEAAFMDYYSQSNGFEKAKRWQSQAVKDGRF